MGFRRYIGATPLAAATFLTAPNPADALDSPHLVTGAAGSPQIGYVYDDRGPHSCYDASSGARTYYLRDAMGTVIALVGDDPTTVDGRATLHYGSFGNIRRTTGPSELTGLPAAVDGDFRLHGMWLEATDLYYVRARTYDPEVGAFTSRDPAAGRRSVPEAVEPYRAFRAQPTRLSDPTGRSTLIEQSVGLNIRFNLATAAAARTLVVAAVGTCTAKALFTDVGPLDDLCDFDGDSWELVRYDAVPNPRFPLNVLRDAEYRSLRNGNPVLAFDDLFGAPAATPIPPQQFINTPFSQLVFILKTTYMFDFAG